MSDNALESQPTTPPNDFQNASLLKSAWNLVHDFVSTDKYTLPGIEQTLQNLLGNQYADADWHSALMAVMNAENDVGKVLPLKLPLFNSSRQQRSC
ncbi:uncharacterized protein BT62DRAFT_935669 [Guyanagaster necrorhizus]|uniref:Uncharacterized protein n=1 Tax=Guyanagaster necrorhizus TaxID=856835 RepID=A0A9P7VN33_9AGAR|nr:uncharacterized protein BT62DRAFT_935669 [Guyanagaster necrorhizus MCA 3950]KAG7442946.1 hypothetical protein BT62DRAFT_935669 [Guyanagaster necrorhizus MCA 3950]